MTAIGLTIMIFFLVKQYLRWESGKTYRKLKKDLGDGAYSGYWKHQVENALTKVRHHYEPCEMQILAIIIGAIFVIAGLQGN
tara:strand:+ start:4387 stop:4632 length:246 start_codon:yes stop_codon:yes gene_type:complete